MAVSQDGKITKQFLKTRSGEFNIESIHSLCLRDASISELSCLGECASLERLDLSKNDITSLQALAGLNQLTSLNLSANKVSSLEGLQSLENLQTLNLAGNLIDRLESLVCISGLDKLTELRLQDKINKLSNPVCQHKQYFDEIQRMFPQLVILDGERVKGRGSELTLLCRQLDSILCTDAGGQREGERMAPKPTPWTTPQFWQTSDTFQSSSLCDSEQQITDLLASCKRSAEKSEEKLFSWMTST